MALARASALLDSFRAAVTAFPGGPVPKPLADMLTQLKVSWHNLGFSLLGDCCCFFLWPLQLAIMELPSLPPASMDSPTQQQEILVARKCVGSCACCALRAALFWYCDFELRVLAVQELHWSMQRF